MNEVVIPEHLGGHMNKTHVDYGSLRYMKSLGCESMIDIGCGPGGQVQAAKELGFKRSLGIDGDWTVLPKEGNFILHDFTEGPYKSFVNYDLAWSVEFLEHVEEQYIPNYMPVFASAKYALVTFAPPGHGGHHHVNEQEMDYWVDIFEKYDMIYNQSLTIKIRQSSTMAKPFMQTRGIAFENRRTL